MRLGAAERSAGGCGREAGERLVLAEQLEALEQARGDGRAGDRETDRLEGRLTEAEYVELKSAYDIVLRRTLSRSAKPVAVEETA